MKTRRRTYVLLVLLVATFSAFGEKVATLPAPTGYIDDYANVLSPSAKAAMEAKARELHDKTRAQVFLVTINTLEGEPVETFANQLFAKWKIGEKKTDRGVLMLFAIKDRKRWIEIGYGLEGILNDAKVGDIGREMVPALRAGNYDEATTLGLNDITSIIAADADAALAGASDTTSPIEQSPTISSAESGQGKRNNNLLLIVILSTIVGLGAFPIILILAIRHSLRRRGVVIGGWDGGWNHTWSDSTNSFTDSGSSDDSFGGGDGGSSGGGGAGGDW